MSGEETVNISPGPWINPNISGAGGITSFTMPPHPRGEIAKALVKVQMELENPLKDKTNPHFKSKYADLAGCLDAARPVLTKYGLCVVQRPSLSGTTVIVDTMLLHESGESLSAPVACEVTRADAQAVGSAITYLRRYGLCAMIGMAADDDDGNVAAGKATPDAKGDAKPFGDPPRKAPAAVAQEVFPEAKVMGDRITEAQVSRLQTIARKSGHKGEAVKAWLALNYGVASSKELKPADYDAVCARLEQREAL